MPVRVTELFAFNTDVGLVETPTDLHRALTLLEFGLKLRAVLDHPPVNGVMVKRHRTLY